MYDEGELTSKRVIRVRIELHTYFTTIRDVLSIRDSLVFPVLWGLVKVPFPLPGSIQSKINEVKCGIYPGY